VHIDLVNTLTNWEY